MGTGKTPQLCWAISPGSSPTSRSGVLLRSTPRRPRRCWACGVRGMQGGGSVPPKVQSPTLQGQALESCLCPCLSGISSGTFCIHLRGLEPPVPRSKDQLMSPGIPSLINHLHPHISQALLSGNPAAPQRGSTPRSQGMSCRLFGKGQGGRAVCRARAAGAGPDLGVRTLIQRWQTRQPHRAGTESLGHWMTLSGPRCKIGAPSQTRGHSQLSSLTQDGPRQCVRHVWGALLAHAWVSQDHLAVKRSVRETVSG